MTTPSAVRLGGRPEAETLNRDLGAGVACGSSTPSPGRGPDGPNEDGALLLELPDGALLAVADGVGGMAVGDVASRAALECLAGAVEDALARGASLREGILGGFEAAQDGVRRAAPGGATTLAVVSIDGGELRSYHAGDSLVLVCGQRGRVHHRNVSHSPVGYAVEAGLLDEDDALLHEDRHVISNAVGGGAMHIEVGPVLRLAARDTVLLASDGLTDNLTPDEIVQTVRRGPLASACDELVRRARARMLAETPADDVPGKPDDLTLLAYRPRRQGARRPS